MKFQGILFYILITTCSRSPSVVDFYRPFSVAEEDTQWCQQSRAAALQVRYGHRPGMRKM
jgi:hypothetical protein